MNAQTQPIEGTAVEVIPTRRPAEIRVVTDPIAVLDTARFEHLQRIATVMAKCNLIPEGLCMTGSGDARQYLPDQTIVANCFLVVNQAVRWNMDPFAVAQCVSVVHGKLCYEGKLIAAVIDAKLGIRLEFKWDSGQGDNLGIVVSGQFSNEAQPRTVTGTVGEWKTTGAGTPWTPRQSRKMLAYRGTREWARLHAPGLMLGVYSDDELADMTDDARANRARNVTPPDPNAEVEVRPEPQPERIMPPNPNGAPGRPRPPNPMGDGRSEAKRADDEAKLAVMREAPRDPLDIPQRLVRVDPAKVKARLLSKIMGFGTKAEADEYVARIDTDIEPLGNPDRAIVARAYAERKAELEAEGD